jgi:hypothetical protein
MPENKILEKNISCMKQLKRKTDLCPLTEDLLKKCSYYHIDVDVTSMTRDEKLEVLSEHEAKVGFVSFEAGWENQFTPKEKMLYTFWYEKVRKTH